MSGLKSLLQAWVVGVCVLNSAVFHAAATSRSQAPSQPAGLFHDPASRELTDANFEHLTQASTGMTTGSWFVMFYSKSCGHCVSAYKHWVEAAKEMEGKVTFAQVDVHANPALKRRFQVKEYPKFMLFHRNKQYIFGGKRFSSDFIHFVTEGFSHARGTAVYKPETAIQSLIRGARAFLKDLKRLAQSSSPAVLLVFAVGLVTGGGVVLAAWSMMSSTADKDLQKDKEESEEEHSKNEGTSSHGNETKKDKQLELRRRASS